MKFLTSPSPVLRPLQVRYVALKNRPDSIMISIAEAALGVQEKRAQARLAFTGQLVRVDHMSPNASDTSGREDRPQGEYAWAALEGPSPTSIAMTMS